MNTCNVRKEILMKRFKDYSQNQPYLLPPSESDLIDENDLVRVVNEVVDSLDLKCLKDKFTGGGCPSFNPVMMLKILIYSYSQRVYSSRNIAKLLKRDIHYMWLSGHQRPDFRTINRFRGDYLKDEMPGIFGEVAMLLIDRGYIKGEDFFVDGTTLEADGNKHKMIWKKNVVRYKENVQTKIQEILNEVDVLNEQEDKKYEGDDLPEYGKAGAITSQDIKETVERINKKINKKTAKELKTLGDKLEKYENQEKTLGDRNSYNKTDPDATAMRMKDETIKPAYNLQVSAEKGFAIGYSLHQSTSDASTFVSHVEDLPVKPKRIVADSAYGSEENYKLLEENKIGSYLKYQNFTKDTKGNHHPFAKEKFIYNKNEDSYTCPKGKILPFTREVTEKNRLLKKYQATGCSFCSAQPICCFSQSSRTIQRSEEYERLKKHARDNLTTELGVSLRKRRGNESESIFGVIKHVKNYKRVRLRSLKKAFTDLGLMLISNNITKMAIVSAKV